MNDSSFQELNYQVQNEVAVITLNRPSSLNAFNTRLRHELLTVLNYSEDDSSVSIRVLTGHGKSFCVGQDLTDNPTPPKSTFDAITQEYIPIIQAIDEGEKPTIAAINGVAAGAGAALALSCDFVVMSADAYMYKAFTAIGLIPDCGANWYLVHQLGYRKALELAVANERIPAQQCMELGLANRVSPDNDCLPLALSWATELAQVAPLALRGTRQALKYAQLHSLLETMNTEAEIQERLSHTEDLAEGITAYLEKRKPKFTGK